MCFSSDTRHHCDPAFSFLIVNSQKVLTHVHPTRLVNREECLRESVHPLFFLQQRNKVRNGPSPFHVHVWACTCICV